MNFAYPMQKFQDWFTQQWVILRGRKIDPDAYPWLTGPFGFQDITGEDFIQQFAAKERLIIERNNETRGLIPSIEMLGLSDYDISNVSKEVIAFYEHTAAYHLDLSVNWHPFFKMFGILLHKLFSNRINQLNIPIAPIQHKESLKSDIITLLDPQSKEVKYTFWFRSVRSTAQVIYSGVYGVCTLPSGQVCIKAVFPLPNGNATVIMTPKAGQNGTLILDSSGTKFGDPGFYFLLKDSKGAIWSQFIRSFRDRLIIGAANDIVSAEQTLTLWRRRVLTFNYTIKARKGAAFPKS